MRVSSLEPTSERTVNSSASREISSSLRSNSMLSVPSESSMWSSPSSLSQATRRSRRFWAMASSVSVPPNMTVIPCSL